MGEKAFLANLSIKKTNKTNHSCYFLALFISHLFIVIGKKNQHKQLYPLFKVSKWIVVRAQTVLDLIFKKENGVKSQGATILYRVYTAFINEYFDYSF